MEVRKLKEELAAVEYDHEEANHNRDLLHDLYENEVIDGDGNIIRK